MARISRQTLVTSTALAALVAVPAAADVTAEDVWNTWKDSTADVPDLQITSGSEEMTGDTLAVRDLEILVDEGIDTFTVNVAEIDLTENGDGTVTIAMSEESLLTITSGDTTVPISIRTDALDILVSGDPEAMNFDVSAAAYEVEVTPGTYEDVEVNTGVLTLSGMSSKYMITEGDVQDLSYTLSVESIAVDADISEAGGTGTFSMAGTVAGMAAEADVTLPEGADTSDNPIGDGLTIVAGYTIGASNYEMSSNIDGESGQASLSFDEMAMAVSMLRDGFSSKTSLASPSVSIFGFEVPFPVEVSMSGLDYEIAGPWAKADSPQDAVLAVGLRDLAVNDLLWSLVDPGGVLPRDPATVAFSLKGQVTPLFDFFDPIQQRDAAIAELPAELNSVSLETLEISAAGAEVAGSGAFTFDNADLETFDGLPRPEGSLKLSVNGANGLIDKLIAMGLLPQEQAVGARMMMGLFATPVGDDMLESVIEINDQGHILANGQRLQ